MGSRKDIMSNGSWSDDTDTTGRASFSSLSSSRRTPAWIACKLSGMIASRPTSKYAETGL